MSDPVGEIEEVIAKALAAAEGPMDNPAAALYLAEVIAPKVVWRESLGHVGWLNAETGDLVAERQNETDRPLFTIPARTVTGTAELEVIFGMG